MEKLKRILPIKGSGISASGKNIRNHRDVQKQKLIDISERTAEVRKEKRVFKTREELETGDEPTRTQKINENEAVNSNLKVASPAFNGR